MPQHLKGFNIKLHYTFILMNNSIFLMIGIKTMTIKKKAILSFIKEIVKSHKKLPSPTLKSHQGN